MTLVLLHTTHRQNTVLLQPVLSSYNFHNLRMAKTQQTASSSKEKETISRYTISFRLN